MSDLRRSGRRAFVPCVDGRPELESRLLLSAVKGKASVEAKAAGRIHYQTAFGGKIALIKDVDGELWSVVIVGAGFVRAKPMSGGRARLIVEGTNSESVLAINPSARTGVGIVRQGMAHDYPTHPRAGDDLLHVGEVKITSGRINQILGYRTAELSGSLIAASDSPVDRIAFYSYQPGTSIQTGGDINTFDAFTDVNLDGSGGIVTARDLNWFNIGGNVNIGSGTTLSVGRDLGLTGQPAKGNSPSGRGGHVTGNLNVAADGSFVITRSLDAPFLVDGNLTGASRISVGAGASNFAVRGTVSD